MNENARLAALVRDTQVFLLDMDGTLYLGDEVFNGAIDFIHTLSGTGRNYIYLTNNSSRAGEDYITRLKKLGFPCERENVFTSGMATGMYLKTRHPGEKVYAVGTPAFERELVSYGVELTHLIKLHSYLSPFEFDAHNRREHSRRYMRYMHAIDC